MNTLKLFILCGFSLCTTMAQAQQQEPKQKLIEQEKSFDYLPNGDLKYIKKRGFNYNLQMIEDRRMKLLQHGITDPQEIPFEKQQVLIMAEDGSLKCHEVYITIDLDTGFALKRTREVPCSEEMQDDVCEFQLQNPPSLIL